MHHKTLKNFLGRRSSRYIDILIVSRYRIICQIVNVRGKITLFYHILRVSFLRMLNLEKFWSFLGCGGESTLVARSKNRQNQELVD